jgi:nucleotide-binding universal stress UspA family protein
MSAYQRILCAIDGSGASAKGLREAVRLAQAEGAELCVLHVVTPAFPYTPPVGAPPVNLFPTLMEEGRHLLDDAVAFATAQGVQARPLLRDTSAKTPADSIVTEAVTQQADLIVLGTHGRRGLERLALGSDAELVVRSASVPVLLVRSAS